MSVNVQTIDIAALDADIKALDADLAELSATIGEYNSEMETVLSELDEEFAAAGLGNGLETTSVGTLAESEVEAAFVNDLVKRKAESLIKMLYGYAKKYGRCVTCIRSLAIAVAAFKARRYPTALLQATKSYNCFRSCARK
jgi:hypothetical protein